MCRLLLESKASALAVSRLPPDLDIVPGTTPAVAPDLCGAVRSSPHPTALRTASLNYWLTTLYNWEAGIVKNPTDSN